MWMKLFGYSDAHKAFPDGVICMKSALEYDRMPSAWRLAVESKSTWIKFYVDYLIKKLHFKWYR